MKLCVLKNILLNLCVCVCVSEWRCEEEQQINLSLRGAERKAALCSLLEQETQLIAAIGRHRIAVQHNNYDKSIRDFLDKVRGHCSSSAFSSFLFHIDVEVRLKIYFD